jgi:hypothetical protein
MGIILFSFCAVMAWRAGEGEVSPLFILFVALGGAFLLFFSGTVEMDAETIICRTPLAQYQIKWDEVSHIEIDTQGSNLVFCGEDKILVALGPLFWSGKDKMEMLSLVNAQVEKHGIGIPQTEKPVFRLSKNTKVS